MARNPETKGYVSWNDVMTVWHWLEYGYNVTLQLRSEVKSPVGEQVSRFYMEMNAWDHEKKLVPTTARMLAQFPTASASTMPGAMLALLYIVDGQLALTREWNEPTFAVKPREGLGA